VRILYNLLTYILLLPYAGYWFVRGIVNRSYWDKVYQRLGAGYPQLERCIWVHAVSVGEVVAAVPLIRALLARYPEQSLLVTTVTPTGAARVAATFGTDVYHAYIPFEMPQAIDNFFASINPEMALVVETEIWPNLYRGCGVRDIPLVLVSARISPKSVKNYRRLVPLFRETLSHGIIIAAQTEADAERFLSLGAAPERTRITGNIKFDIELPPDLAERGQGVRDELFGERPVWIAASTHEGEESLVLEAHQKLLELVPGLLLILVPRHPQRFAAVRDLIDKQALSVVARTEARPCEASTAVFLGDTMGEMTLFYAASDVAFVGGSLTPVGGHNLLEPAALGIPLVSGPHVFNAQEIADMFIETGACRLVEDADQLADAVGELLADRDKAKERGELGRRILERNRGALERLLEMIDSLLPRA
jgi:3-deoxy-D-manno-octulosonic-acid transferase